VRWLQIGSFIDSAGDKERHFSECVDSGSIHGNGDMVKMWAMEDNKVEYHRFMSEPPSAIITPKI